MRWQKNYKLIDPEGRLLKAWECSRGKRSLDHRMIYDARRRCQRKTGIVFLPVRVPDFPTSPSPWSFPAQAKVANPGICSPMNPCLLSMMPGASSWLTIAAGKSKSPSATVNPNWPSKAPACSPGNAGPNSWPWLPWFRPSCFPLLDDLLLPLRSWLLDHWCHRTGKRSRSTAAPLYRLRLALSQLWLAFRPLSLPRLN